MSQPPYSPQPYPGQPYPGQPYPGQPYPGPYSNPRTNTMAILSLVFAFLFWPLGIAFGHIGRRQIRETGEGGSGLALAGLIISYVGLALTVLYVVVIVIAIAVYPTAG